MRPPTKEEKQEAAKTVAETLKLEMALSSEDGFDAKIVKAKFGDDTAVVYYVHRRKLMRMCGNDAEVYAYAEERVRRFAVIVRKHWKPFREQKIESLVWDEVLWERVIDDLKANPTPSPVYACFDEWLNKRAFVGSP